MIQWWTLDLKRKVFALSNVVGVQICNCPESIPITIRCKVRLICAKRHHLLILSYGQKKAFLLKEYYLIGKCGNRLCMRHALFSTNVFCQSSLASTVQENRKLKSKKWTLIHRYYAVASICQCTGNYGYLINGCHIIFIFCDKIIIFLFFVLFHKRYKKYT